MENVNELKQEKQIKNIWFDTVNFELTDTSNFDNLLVLILESKNKQYKLKAHKRELIELKNIILNHFNNQKLTSNKFKV